MKNIILILSLCCAILPFMCLKCDDLKHDESVIHKLFYIENVKMTNVSWRIYDKLTGENAMKQRMWPRQDAEYNIEGAFRIERNAVLPMEGSVAHPSGYEQYTKTQVDDWKSNEDFTHKLLKEPHTGEVFFSPETNWIYFNLKLK